MNSFEVCWKLVLLMCSLQIFDLIKKSEAKEVSCESVSDWGRNFGDMKTCFMDTTTSIDEPGVVISPSDEEVKGLQFYDNKKISHLPDNTAEAFPNLKVYSAKSCSLKEISERNFNGLVKLKSLGLGYNQIEKIASGTFDGLAALEELYLFGNKIKFMNGEAFRGLSKLSKVELGWNECISEKFLNPTQIAGMQRIVTEKCGYNEKE